MFGPFHRIGGSGAKLEVVQYDFDINARPPEALPDNFKWRLDIYGRLISANNLIIVPKAKGDFKAGDALHIWNDYGSTHKQVWIVSDRPYINGFVLRFKDDPQSVLDDRIDYQIEDPDRISVSRYTGSIWQHWTLTREGYLAKAVSSSKLYSPFDKMMVLDISCKLL